MFAMAKRVFLFLVLNLLIVFTISLLLSFLGVRPGVTVYGINYEHLMIFCLAYGMGAAMISLALSRVMAKWMMGVKVIDPQIRDPQLQDLVQTVHRLAQGAGLSKMPEVGIYNSPELNAFATGPTKARSLVAVSTGLLQRMRKEEVEGVLGHEIAHIANGDMVTMTLVQGIVNAFVMFLSRVLAWAVVNALRSKDDRGGGGFPTMMYFIVTMVLEVFFMILGSIVVAWVSRRREYRADAGGARLAGREKMIGALRALKQGYGIVDEEQSTALQTLKISGHPKGLLRFFASHPPLDERIQRLEMMTG